MRLPGRLAAAIEVLETIETQRRPVAAALKDWGNAHRFAGSGDRSAIGNLVYDALRHRSAFAAHMNDDSARAAILATVCLLPGYDRSGPLDFEGDPHAPEPLTEAEQHALQQPATWTQQASNNSSTTAANLANSPDWLWAHFERVFGDDAVAEVGAMAARAPLDVRLNPATSKPERVDKALSRHCPEKLDAFPLLRRVPATQGFGRAPHITSDEAFQKGWIEVQDAGSQFVTELAVAGQKPRTVLDLCAGAGGKTLALTVAMDGRGQVFAHDIDRRRMKDLWPRVKRAKAHNVQVIDPDDLQTHELAERGFDLVVVDAPCTGTGTWRRHPDTKWRVTEAALETRLREQKAVLEQAVKLTRAGGRIAYITCSLLAEENEDQMAAVLADHADLAPMSSSDMIKSLGRETVPDILPSISVGDYEAGALGLRLTPATSGTDGFFIACLQKAAESAPL